MRERRTATREYSEATKKPLTATSRMTVTIYRAENDMPVYSFMASLMSIPNPINRTVPLPNYLLTAPAQIHEEPDGTSSDRLSASANCKALKSGARNRHLEGGRYFRVNLDSYIELAHVFDGFRQQNSLAVDIEALTLKKRSDLHSGD